MRSRGFAVAMGFVCGALAIACAVLFFRALNLRTRREALPRAIELYQAGELQKALPCLEQAMAAAPNRTDLIHLAGTICLKLKRFDQARGYFLRLRDAASGPERVRAESRLALVAL